MTIKIIWDKIDGLMYHGNYTFLYSGMLRMNWGISAWENTSGPNDSETQSSHVSLTTLWGHSHTEFKSLQLPSPHANIFQKHGPLPMTQHLKVQY